MGSGKSTNRPLDERSMAGEAIIPAAPGERKSAKGKKSVSKQKRSVLLLLGTAGVGKSTVVKQLTSSIGEGFDRAEQVLFLEAIYENLVTTCKNIIEYCTKDDTAIETHESALETMEAFSDIKDDLDLKSIRGIGSETADRTTVDNVRGQMKKIRELVRKIWCEPSIKASLVDIQESFDFELALKLECCMYFLDVKSNWDRLCSPDYIPCDKDIIRLRLPSQGIVNYEFAFEEFQFMLRDVGGQLHHQESWREGFDGASAALFVVNLCDYRNFNKKDGKKENALEQTRKLLMKLAVTEGFGDLPYVLLFNKIDKFNEDIKTKPINVCPRFRDVKGQQESESDDQYADRCQRIIKKWFLSGFRKAREARYKETQFGEAKAFFSCALDTDMTKNVMSRVVRGIVCTSLMASGFATSGT